MWISIVELTALLGKDRALALSSAMGGVRVYVPAAPGKTHRLAAVIGLEGMASLCAACGGITLTIPKTSRVPVKEKIFTLLCQGRAYGEVARESGSTLRYVRHLASLDARER